MSHGNPDCCQQKGEDDLVVAVETIRALGKAEQKVMKPPQVHQLHTHTHTHTLARTHPLA